MRRLTPPRSGKELADRRRALSPHTRILFTSACTAKAIAHPGVVQVRKAKQEKQALTLDCVVRMRLSAPHRIIPAVSAMLLVSEGGHGRAFHAGANLAAINLTPRAVRVDYPISHGGNTLR